jgi:signal transduction histidine kinase
MSINRDCDAGHASVAVEIPAAPAATADPLLRWRTILTHARALKPRAVLLAMRRQAPHAWLSLRRWLEANSYNPGWLPRAWRHPLAGYAGAVMLQLCGALATFALARLLPTFVLPGLPVALAVMLVALAWGAGPALCSALVGTALINVPGIAPHFTSPAAAANSLFEISLLLVAGLGLGVIVGQARRARRDAEELALLIEAERDRMQTAIEAVATRMDDFLSIASHEIRTPLTAIRANAQLLARRLQNAAPIAHSDDSAQITETARALVDRIQRQVARLNRLVDDLVSTSHIQTSRLDLRLAPCDLATIVREAVVEQRQMTPGRAIQLDLPDGLSACVVADADRVSQVLANYLSNALKFSAEDRPVAVRLQREDAVARVLVRDEGPGLPPAERERIWERFHRAAGVEVCSGSGVGLGIGLYISREIIERHGGQVGVTSAPGAGATFWFTLPLAAGA